MTGDNQTEILIIGAGACGFMAARELAKVGKKVLILEARERIGGRIWPLPKEEFGYLAQAGAEFVHGEASITKSLLKEANLTYEEAEGEQWSLRGGKLSKSFDGPTAEKIFLDNKERLHEKLKELKEDLPISNFLEINFGDDEYAEFRNWVIKMVEGYEAADPRKISTFALREDWLEGQDWKQGRIKEGYGALLDFLKSECEKNGVVIELNKKVESVEIMGEEVSVKCIDGSVCTSPKVIITLPLPILQTLRFVPDLPEKISAASKIGFGQVIKFIFKFKTMWWSNAFGEDLSRMGFMLTDTKVEAWWTQYPEMHPVLVGWIACTTDENLQKSSVDDVVRLGLDSLSQTFKVSKEFLQNELISSRVFNWSNDPFAHGVYSYPTPEMDQAWRELVEPVQNKIFFAGEALYSGKESSTVEGALGSGKEIAEKVLNV